MNDSVIDEICLEIVCCFLLIDGTKFSDFHRINSVAKVTKELLYVSRTGRRSLKSGNVCKNTFVILGGEFIRWCSKILT